jgi:glycosyltransferase involved in cell wall biosynthesis
VNLLWLQQKRGAFGGAEANVLATATALQAQGVRNTLLYGESTGVAEEAWSEAFESQILAPAGEALLSLARKLQPDAIWIHNWNRSDDFLRLKELHIPLGRMVHDHALYCMRHYKYHPLTRKNCNRPASWACLFPCAAFLQRGNGPWPFRLASLGDKLREIRNNQALDRILVASDFMKRELVRNRFDAAKIRLLPPVPPPPPQDPRETLAAHHHKSPRQSTFVPGRILFIGQVIRGKGVDLLLRALSGMPGDWHLSLAGQGSALPSCKKLMRKLGLEERVTLHGHLNPTELSQQYREAQFLVVPSTWPEPFGMVGIEAMRHAKAVVGFAVGGIPEWLRDGENGRLVPPADVPALRATMASLLNDPARCLRLGQNGLALAQTEFSFVRYIKGLHTFLHEMQNVTPTPAPL